MEETNQPNPINPNPINPNMIGFIDSDSDDYNSDDGYNSDDYSEDEDDINLENLLPGVNFDLLSGFNLGDNDEDEDEDEDEYEDEDEDEDEENIVHFLPTNITQPIMPNITQLVIPKTQQANVTQLVMPKTQAVVPTMTQLVMPKTQPTGATQLVIPKTQPVAPTQGIYSMTNTSPLIQESPSYNIPTTNILPPIFGQTQEDIKLTILPTTQQNLATETKRPTKSRTVNVAVILEKMPGISISGNTPAPTRVSADINDILQKEADETLEDFEARRILTLKLVSIPDYKLNNSTAVIAGLIMMKKSKLGITYDNDVESAIGYLTALLARQI